MGLDEVEGNVVWESRKVRDDVEGGVRGVGGNEMPLPMKGRVMMWVNKSVMEQGVKRENAKRMSPWWEWI